MTTNYERIAHEIRKGAKDGEIKHEDVLRIILFNKDPDDNANEVYDVIIDLGIITRLKRGKKVKGAYTVINEILNWRVMEIDKTRY